MKEKGWKDIPEAGLIEEAGNSDKYPTGGWRTFKPNRDAKKCVDCGFCDFYCPDTAIEFKDGKFIKYDYEHCKGCGLCAKVCPVKCIKMENER